MGLEAAMVEPLTQVNGVVSILDMKGLTFAQIMQFTPSFAKMIVDWIQVGGKPNLIIVLYDYKRDYKLI